MKPHALRKTLWFVNIALVVACLGVGTWFFTKVRPAAAAVTKRPKSDIPAQYQKIQKDYEQERQTGLKWEPKAPVSEPDIKQYILIPKFETTDPKHWVFSGPLPPEKQKEVGPATPVSEKPKGLELLGKVTTVMFNPPTGTVVLFAFSGGEKKSRAFGIGDWVRQDNKAPKVYRLTEVVEVGDAAYEVRYAVFSGGKAEPDFSGAVPYGKGAAPKEWPAWLRPYTPPAPKPTATPAGTPTLPGGAGELAAGPGAAGEGASAEGGVPAEGEGAEGESTAGETEVTEAESTPTVIEARKPVEEITVEDMRPEIRENPNNRNERAILVDENTYRVLKSKNAATIASTVKTEVAVDKRTGRTLGMRITGLKEGSAAGALQVKKGDILVSINGQKVESRSAAIAIVERLNPENLVTIVIDRHGKLLTYKVDPSDPKTRRQVRYFDDLK
jgi:hypothetical protein